MATKKNFTKLVSFWLDNDVIESLEKVVKSDGCHSTSKVINFLLKGVLNHTAVRDIRFMINIGSSLHTKWHIKIELS